MDGLAHVVFYRCHWDIVNSAWGHRTKVLELFGLMSYRPDFAGVFQNYVNMFKKSPDQSRMKPSAVTGYSFAKGHTQQTGIQMVPGAPVAIHRSQTTAAIALVALIGLLTSAQAQGRLDWVEFFPDDKAHVTKKLSKNVSVGAELEFTAQRSENLDLNTADDEDEDEIELQANLGLLYDNGARTRAYLELNLVYERLGGVETNARDVILDVNEAYVTFRSDDRSRALTFGRWKVSDEREWLFDEELDGIHFYNRGEKFAFELMYAREQILQKDLLDDHDDDEPDHFYARAYANLPGDAVGSIYGLYQMGQKTGDADLFWLGASVAGEFKDDIKYWGEFAHVRGKEMGRSVRGYGLDVGVTKTFIQFRSNPRLTAAIGFGSGDNGLGKDTAFRQTDIQGNEKRFGGNTKVKYYGEVFDPELSNLTVLTLGAGFDFLQKSSIDLMYHYNFQNRSSNSIRDSKLDQKPSGNSRDLGHEIDVIVGFREINNVNIDFTAGVFFPGAAFKSTSSPGGFVAIDISTKF